MDNQKMSIKEAAMKMAGLNIIVLMVEILIKVVGRIAFTGLDIVMVIVVLSTVVSAIYLKKKNILIKLPIMILFLSTSFSIYLLAFVIFTLDNKASGYHTSFLLITMFIYGLLLFVFYIIGLKIELLNITGTLILLGVLILLLVVVFVIGMMVTTSLFVGGTYTAVSFVLLYVAYTFEFTSIFYLKKYIKGDSL